MQVRFGLIQRNKISYLIVHLHEKASDKSTSFDMTMVREKESDSKNVKRTQDIREKP